MTTTAAASSNSSSTYDRRRLVIPLTAVSVVCHTRLGLDALADDISAFIAPASHRRWTIELACERGHEQLLRRLVALEPADTNEFLRSHVFGKALVHAVCHDNLALLESLKMYCPTGFASWGMEQAAALGKVHLLEWLEANCPNIVWGSRIVKAAAAHGHVRALEWLKAYRSRSSPERSTEDVIGDPRRTIECAAQAGHFEAVRWLHENVNRLFKCEDFASEALFRALHGGRMETVRYLYEHGYRLLYRHSFVYPIDTMLQGGCSSVADLEWLWANEFKRDSFTAVIVAAERGQTDIVRWLLEYHRVAKGQERELLYASAKHGHLEILQLVIEYLSSTPAASDDADGSERAHRHAEPRLKPRAYDGHLLVEAAGAGHLAVVQWLFENVGVDSTERLVVNQLATANAAVHGHTEVAEWIHARIGRSKIHFRNIGYTVHMYYVAIEQGNLEGLKWLTEYLPCQRFNRDNQETAVKFGRLDILVWLREQFGRDWTDSCLIDVAAMHGHLDIVKWLHALPDGQEHSTTRAMDGAARNNHLHVVKWLHENRSEGCTTYAMDSVASIEMVAWLHEHRSEGCTTDAMDNAARNGDLETLMYLHKYRDEGCTVHTAQYAHEADQPDVLRWLLATYPDTMTREALCSPNWNQEFSYPVMVEAKGY